MTYTYRQHTTEIIPGRTGYYADPRFGEWCRSMTPCLLESIKAYDPGRLCDLMEEFTGMPVWFQPDSPPRLKGGGDGTAVACVRTLWNTLIVRYDPADGDRVLSADLDLYRGRAFTVSDGMNMGLVKRYDNPILDNRILSGVV